MFPTNIETHEASTASVNNTLVLSFAFVPQAKIACSFGQALYVSSLRDYPASVLLIQLSCPHRLFAHFFRLCAASTGCCSLPRIPFFFSLLVQNAVCPVRFTWNVLLSSFVSAQFMPSLTSQTRNANFLLLSSIFFA